jgi:di/tricarboxylate transporter
VTVGVLYIVVTGLKETGGITWLAQSMLGRPTSLANVQLRLTIPVAFLSALLNNTPVVAMLIPAVSEWARRYNIPLSKLMIPLSYAAIAGGTCTLIGTSTNLVVNGLLMSESGLPSLSMFEIAWVGLPCTILVVVFMYLTSPWLLPERKSAFSQFEDPREYTVEMLVEPHSPLDGKTIEAAGLRQLPGLYLVEVNRNDQLIPAVSSQETLKGHDRLIFVGIIDSVVDLQKILGLKPATNQIFKLDTPRENRSFIEAVVSNSCPLVGKTIREGRFRSIYNAAVIGVARNGTRLKEKIGDIVLRPGDTLLLEAPPAFTAQQHNSRDFYLVSRLGDSSPPRHEKFLIAMVIVLSMVAAVSFGWLTMLHAAMLAAGFMIITRCTSGRIARRGIDWQVLVTIAASFGIGNALHESGAASAIAQYMVFFSGDSPVTALAMVFFTTALFTALTTNNAAAILMFPIAIAISNGLHVSVLPFAITIMMAASASFATPIGYQTNLMVYGPGGYRFSDYLRIGLPLTMLVGILTIIVVPAVWLY